MSGLDSFFSKKNKKKKVVKLKPDELLASTDADEKTTGDAGVQTPASGKKVAATSDSVIINDENSAGEWLEDEPDQVDTSELAIKSVKLLTLDDERKAAKIEAELLELQGDNTSSKVPESHDWRSLLATPGEATIQPPPETVTAKPASHSNSTTTTTTTTPAAPVDEGVSGSYVPPFKRDTSSEKYVPPSQRGAWPRKPANIDLNSQQDFPSLGDISQPKTAEEPADEDGGKFEEVKFKNPSEELSRKEPQQHQHYTAPISQRNRFEVLGDRDEKRESDVGDDRFKMGQGHSYVPPHLRKK